MVKSFGWLLCALALPLVASKRGNLLEGEVDELNAHAGSTADVGASSKASFDSNEHKVLGDLAWDTFQDAAPGTIKDWAARHGIKGDRWITSELSVKEVTDKFRNDSLVLDENQLNNKRILAFGDFTFLAGDFFADEKNGGNLEKPEGIYFMQKDPLRPLFAIKDGSKRWQSKTRLHNLSLPGLVRASKDWRDIEVPMLVRAVRSIAAQGAAYDSGAKINFIARQGLFVALTSGRYGELAYTNHNHFGILARREYNRYHDLALNRAYEAGKSKISEALVDAFEIEAMGTHYLSDLFSAGHVRVPRTQLQAVCGDGKVGGLLRGSSVESRLPGGVPVAGYLAKMMHDEDGKLGVELRGVGDGSWTAYGDSMYFSKQGKTNKDKVIGSLVGGLNSVLSAFLDGLSGKDLGRHPAAIPELGPIQRFAPLFKIDSPKKPGSNISLVMRTTRPDAPKPEYILIDKDCSGITVKCRICAASIKDAERAKTSAKLIGETASCSPSAK